MTERLHNQNLHVVDLLLWLVGVPVPLVLVLYMLFN
jgi:hypothetical protein